MVAAHIDVAVAVGAELHVAFGLEEDSSFAGSRRAAAHSVVGLPMSDSLSIVVDAFCTLCRWRS